MAEETWLTIGQIVGSHGLKGEVRVYPDSDFPERFLAPGPRWLQRPGSPQPEQVDLVRGRFLDGKGLYVVQFKQVTNRTEADALRKGQLMVPASDRPELEPGEFYVADLIGLTVILQDTHQEIGTVVDVYAAGNDLLAIQLKTSPKEAKLPADPETEDTEDSVASQAPDVRSSAQVSQADSMPPRKSKGSRGTTPVLVPFVPEIVPVVDLNQGYVSITPPPGLLDL